MIDEKIQAQLRAKYNPEGSPLRKHQLRMLEMLKYFDEFCKKNGIRYWLSSGNCLGLVRHNGFIPWDDDIDVEMLREDYLKFKKLFNETDDYVLQTWKNDKYYIAPYAKLRDKNSRMDEGKYHKHNKYKGVFIDIFPMEPAPRFCCKLLFYYRWNLIFPLLPSDNKMKKCLLLILKYILFLMIAVSRYLFGWLPKNKIRYVYGSDWFEQTRDLNDIFPLKRAFFDGVEVSVPNNLHNYLNSMYGDYMKLPSEDKIQQPHASNVELW